jgi:lycopene cyclase domain-containing protein
VSILYLLFLCGGLSCMVLLDRRFALFFWRDGRRAAIVIAVGVAFFMLWDLFGIGLRIFRLGETRFMTGILIAPQLPLEEVFFLTFLCYLTMVLLTAVQRWFSSRTRSRR